MSESTRKSARLLATACVTVGLGIGSLTACSALDVSSPTQIAIEDFQNATGAHAALAGARESLQDALRASILSGGALTDELFLDAPRDYGDPNVLLDRRLSTEYEDELTAGGSGLYGDWQTAWVKATIAMSFIRSYALASERDVELGESFALRGFATLGLADQICPGFPARSLDAHDLSALTPSFTGAPQTTDSAFLRAIADFDSALALAGDSVRVLNLARVGKARALLGLGRFAEAGDVAAIVTAGYVSTLKSSIYYTLYYGSYSVSDGEGSTGLDFVSEGDPRLPLTAVRQATYGDTTTVLYIPMKYDTGEVQLVLASEIEAQLILAEAQLAAAPNGPEWLETLNVLRRTVSLSDASDPGTDDARVDLLFHERAFWLFATGHRLGDFRRLISHYGRGAETVFPTGRTRLGEFYGTATNIPFPGAVENTYNTAITGCLSR